MPQLTAAQRRVLMTIVLIVEDDAFIREVAEMTIQDWGYGTLSAGSADDALVVLRSPKVVDVLFTDICLKTDLLGGCELARQAADLRPGMRVLDTTGHYVTGTLRGRFVEGGNAFANRTCRNSCNSRSRKYSPPSLEVAHSYGEIRPTSDIASDLSTILASHTMDRDIPAPVRPRAQVAGGSAWLSARV